MSVDMSVIETIRKNPNISMLAAGALILIFGIVILLEVFGSHENTAGVSTKAYFTTDDTLVGAAAVNALFVDDANKVPPFDHHGKPAFRAVVYTCNGGRVRWVNLLARYTPEMKPKAEAAAADAISKGNRLGFDNSDFLSGMEVKATGPGPWVKATDPAGLELSKVHLPSGVSGDDLQFAVP
jgi:hypothetical protein